MKLFNGFVKAIKTWLILDERLAMIENRLNSLEQRVDELYHLLCELLRKN